MGDNFIDDGKASVMWIAWALLSRSSPSFATAAIDDPPRLINTRPVSKGLHALSKPPSFIYAASRVAKPEKLPKLAPSSESWARRCSGQVDRSDAVYNRRVTESHRHSDNGCRDAPDNSKNILADHPRSDRLFFYGLSLCCRDQAHNGRERNLSAVHCTRVHCSDQPVVPAGAYRVARLAAGHHWAVRNRTFLSRPP